MAKTAQQIHDEAIEIVCNTASGRRTDAAKIRGMICLCHFRLCESNDLAEKQAVATARTNELLERVVKKMGANGG